MTSHSFINRGVLEQTSEAHLLGIIVQMKYCLKNFDVCLKDLNIKILNNLLKGKKNIKI